MDNCVMENKICVEEIPAIVWGEPSGRAFIAVHGNMSNKEDAVIRLLAQEAGRYGYQTLSFDLPEHGERTQEGVPCKVQNCVRDLRTVMAYARNRWESISLFACSMGAYFSLLEYKNEPLTQALFLSPVVDMKRIIENMMTWFGVTEGRLKEEREISTLVGQTLYWDYYRYVLDHPVENWNCPTSILYGANDSLCERDTIDSFAGKFGCALEVVDQGEHYFHTPEQMERYTTWLKKRICGNIRFPYITSGNE